MWLEQIDTHYGCCAIRHIPHSVMPWWDDCLHVILKDNVGTGSTLVLQLTIRVAPYEQTGLLAGLCHMLLYGNLLRSLEAIFAHNWLSWPLAIDGDSFCPIVLLSYDSTVIRIIHALTLLVSLNVEFRSIMIKASDKPILKAMEWFQTKIV